MTKSFGMPALNVTKTFVHFNELYLIIRVIIQIKMNVFISSRCNVETLLKHEIIFVNPLVKCCRHLTNDCKCVNVHKTGLYITYIYNMYIIGRLY